MSRSSHPAAGLILLFFALFVPLNNHPALSAPGPEGAVIYHKDYHLYTYPAWYKLPEEKRYLSRIYQALLFDLLQIQRQVYVENATPVEVIYPEEIQSAKSRADYLLQSQKPSYFNLVISKSKQPAGFSPQEWNSANHAPLPEEAFHLFSSIESLPSTNRQGNYRLSLFLFFGKERLFSAETTSPEDQLVQKSSLLAAKLREALSGPSTGSVAITSQIPGSSIYLNGVFFGKTPAQVEHLISGEYDLTLRKEGAPDWKTKITVSPGREVSVSAANREELEKLSGVLRVVSEPPGADVYLDVTYRGQTPLVIDNVRPGKYRLRLSHEGRIDQYRSVVISPGAAPADPKEPPGQKNAPAYDANNEELPTLYVSLPPGVSSEHYQINPPVFLGLTYEQLFQGSALTTGGLLLGGLFCLTQYENLAKQASDLRALLNPTTQTQSQADSYAGEAAVYKSISDGLFIGAGVGLALSAYLFIEYVNSQDLNIAQLPLKGKRYAFLPLAGPQESGMLVSHFW